MERFDIFNPPLNTSCKLNAGDTLLARSAHKEMLVGEQGDTKIPSSAGQRVARASEGRGLERAPSARARGRAAIAPPPATDHNSYPTYTPTLIT
mgnify:CR=1 FL=1